MAQRQVSLPLNISKSTRSHKRFKTLGTNEQVSIEVIPGIYRIKLPLPFTPLAHLKVLELENRVKIAIMDGRELHSAT